jgi:hypothetical protein
MKLEFDTTGKNYIEIKEVEGKVIISLSVKNSKNPLSTLVNSAEITKDQFKDLTKDINFEI